MAVSSWRGIRTPVCMLMSTQALPHEHDQPPPVGPQVNEQMWLYDVSDRCKWERMVRLNGNVTMKEGVVSVHVVLRCPATLL